MPFLAFLLLHLQIGQWSVSKVCDVKPYMGVLLSCALECDALSVRISPRDSQHVCFTNMFTDDFLTAALCNFDRGFSDLNLH